MSKIEEKILEEIRKRVLERDENLRLQKDKNEYRKATKEALAEMTSLSKTEIDEISGQVEHEILYKEKQKKAKYKRIALWVAIAGVFISLWVITRKPKEKFTESFSDNKAGWGLYETFDYKRTINPGAYIFETGIDNYCYWDYVPVDLPAKYTIEAKSTWLEGVFDEYSIILTETNTDYACFQLNSEGKYSYAQHQGTKWTISNTWKSKLANTGDGKTSNIQKIIVKNNDFEYYINDQLAESGTMKPLAVRNVGFRVCSKQIIALNYIKITDDIKNTLIFNENFSPAQKAWSPEIKLQNYRKIENGKLTLEGFSQKDFFWTSAKFLKIYPNYDFHVTCEPIKGEVNEFGAMILFSKDDFVSFDLRKNGKARSTECYGGVYIRTGNNIDLNLTENEKKSFKILVQIRGKNYSYFVNGKKADEGTMKGSEFPFIGLYVSGLQKVSFDNLVIEEK